MSNFRRFWCSFTCSPYQSSFVEVTSSSICDQTLHPGPNKNQGGGCEGTPSSEEQKPTAQSVVVKVDAVYASELFESCKSVTVAATGQRVMDLVSSWSHQTFKNKHAVSLSLPPSLPPSLSLHRSLDPSIPYTSDCYLGLTAPACLSVNLSILVLSLSSSTPISLFRQTQQTF